MPAAATAGWLITVSHQGWAAPVGIGFTTLSAGARTTPGELQFGHSLAMGGSAN